MRLSARNVFKGKIKEIKPGTVNSEVILAITGGTQVVAIITKESVEKLGLAKGKDAYAIVKATNVMVGVD